MAIATPELFPPDTPLSHPLSPPPPSSFVSFVAITIRAAEFLGPAYTPLPRLHLRGKDAQRLRADADTGRKMSYDLLMQFLQETEHERTIRRLRSCTHTLHSIIEELDDPVAVEQRADLLIAAENLIEAASFVTDQCRGIAWQHSPLPGADEEEEEI